MGLPMTQQEKEPRAGVPAMRLPEKQTTAIQPREPQKPERIAPLRALAVASAPQPLLQMWAQALFARRRKHQPRAF
jgi:hypothetical protein